jgi:dTDP-4-amino-4,6-dideoxygalactose transaminase
MNMRMLGDSVVESVVQTIEGGRLFRYDCKSPEESATALLEKKFAETFGFKYVLAMNSCSSGLFVSLLCAGVQPGDKVAIPAFTFIAVPSAIVHAGAQPVLVEVTEDYVLDVDDFEKKVNGGDVKALLLSYMRGRIPDLDRVLEICETYNVVLIEDAAHSLGVLWDGVQTGQFGLAAAFSAQSYKMIDGGEGGIFVTNDKETAYKAMMYTGAYEQNWQKHFGTQDDEALIKSMTHAYPAYNFRMSNLSAAALIPQLDQVDARVEHFNRNYNLLVDMLSDHPNVRVPQFHPKMRPAADSIQWEFVGLKEQQINAIQQHMQSAGYKMEIFTGENARCYWNWRFFKRVEECPFTRQLLQRTIDLRLRLHNTPQTIQETGKTVLAALAKVC